MVKFDRISGKRVCHIFKGLTGNEAVLMPNPVMEEVSSHVCNFDNEQLSGPTKRWVFKIVHHCCIKLAHFS